MYICICNSITDNQIKKIIEEHPHLKFKEIIKQLSIGNQCGKCLKMAHEIIHKHKKS